MKPTSREKDTLGVDRQGVDDSVVSTEIEYKCAFRTFPFFDVVAPSRTRCERIFRWMNSKSANRFLVMCQRNHRFAGSEIP